MLFYNKYTGTCKCVFAEFIKTKMDMILQKCLHGDNMSHMIQHVIVHWCYNLVRASQSG